MLLLFLQLSPGMHLIMPHQIERLLPSVHSLALFCLFYHRQWFFFDCFAVPLLLLLPLSLSAAVYSASFAVAETRTQDLFSHLYVCKGRQGGGRWSTGKGPRGYVNFSVKIHFVIMDFPCRIHRCRRRCWRLCHGTYNTTPATSTPFPYPSSLHGSDNYLHSPNLSPSRCLMFLGHDRWQVSVGVASCKFFFWVLERASDMFWNVKVTSSSTPRCPLPIALSSHPVCVRAGVSKILTNTRTQICRFIWWCLLCLASFD